MEEISEQEKEEQTRVDLRGFALICARHWSASIVAILGGSIATFYQTTTGNPVPIAIAWTVGLIGFFSAAFLGWRDERRAKEKALADTGRDYPDVAGLWKRTKTDGLTMRIEQTGERLKSKFLFDDYDHDLTAHWEAESRKFIQETYRTNRRPKGKTITMRGTIELWNGHLIILTTETDGTELDRNFNEVSVLDKFGV